MKGKLISLLTSFLCVMSSSLVHAQSVQHGMVLEYQGRDAKTPLAGVSVAAKGAAAVMSDADGRFALDFRTLHAGDAIQFRRVELSGYEVMNQEALEVARVAHNNDNANLNPNSTSLNVKPSTLNVIMIKRENLLKLRDGYRSVAAQRYEKQLKASEAEIERLKNEGKLAEEQYNERMNALEEAYEEKLSQLETYIDKFARIDLSDLDQDELQIIDMVQAGNFDEALDLYDKQNLADRLRQSREDQQKLVAMRDQLSDAAQKKALENERLRQSIDRQITLLMMAGSEENMFRAHLILQQTYFADTTDWEARRKYALSLEYYQKFEEQQTLLKNGIECAPDNYAKGLLTGELMRAFWKAEKYEESMACATKMRDLMMPLEKEHYTILTRALPSWSDIQLRYYLQKNDLEACAQVEHMVRSHWSPDSLSFKSLCSYSTLLSLLSDYYSGVLNHEQSIWSAEEGIKLGEIIYKRAPWVSILGHAHATGCSTFLLEGLAGQAMESVRHFLTLSDERLSVSNAQSNLTNIAIDVYIIVESLVPAGCYALADSIMQFADRYRLFESKAENDGGVMSLYSALYHYYQSQVWLYQGKLNDAESLSRKSLSRLETLEEGAHLALSLKPEMDARIQLCNRKYKEAERSCQQAIKICSENYEQSEDAWDADALCRYYILLAEIYKQTGNKKKLHNTIIKAERVSLFESNRVFIEKLKKWQYDE